MKGFTAVALLPALFPFSSAYNSDVTDIPGVNIINGTTATIKSQFIFAEANDLSAIIVENGGVATVINSQIFKTGDTSDPGDSSFTGLNAAVVVQEGGKLVMRDSFIYSNGSSANTVKVYQDGSEAYLYGVTIFTEGDSAHGPYIAGGYLYTKDCIVHTTPAHASGYATDRGGGTIEIHGGSVETHGQGSPVQYSTGNITSFNLVGLVLDSPCMAMDGSNYNYATNPYFTCNPSTEAALFMINSFGNATAAGTIGATGGTLNNTADSPFIVSTNAISEFYLNSVNIVAVSSVFVNNSARMFGTAGYNGGHASIYMTKQKASGDVYVDSISSAALVLSKKSSLSGALNPNNSGGNATIIIDGGSSWSVTGTSYVTTLETQATCFANIASNGHTVYYDINHNAGYQGKTYTLPGGGYLKPFGTLAKREAGMRIMPRDSSYSETVCSRRIVPPSYSATAVA